jgi:hypothetical protein
MSRGDHDETAPSGGPGSSAKRAMMSDEERRADRLDPDSPTNGRQSNVSGGGGERDSHHSANPTDKGGQAQRQH